MNNTSGPWHRNIKPASRYPVIFAGRNTHVAIVERQGLSEAEIEANCDLITAAPDMASALLELRKQLREHVKFDVKKHYSLMLADVAADKALRKAGAL